MKEFTIASNNDYNSEAEANLHNLKIRLRIQEKAIERTKSEIKHFEEMLKNNK